VIATTLSAAFGLATIITYGLTTVGYLLAWLLDTERAWRTARRLLIAVLAIHTLGLIVRSLSLGRDPFFTVSEAPLFFAWALVGIFLLADLRGRFPALGVFVTPFALLLVLLALLHPAPALESLPQSLKSPWRLIHVPTAFLGYASFVLAFCAAVAYLLQDHLLKAKRLDGLAARLPSLETADLMGYRLVGLGFVMLTAALGTGAVWAHSAWQAGTSPDPKVALVGVTWLVYAAYLHARRVSGWRGRRVNAFLVLGFLCVVVSYLGIHLFPSTQHRF